MLQYTRLPCMISTFPELGLQIPWNWFRVTRPTFLVTADVYIIPAAIYPFSGYVATLFTLIAVELRKLYQEASKRDYCDQFYTKIVCYTLYYHRKW